MNEIVKVDDLLPSKIPVLQFRSDRLGFASELELYGGKIEVLIRDKWVDVLVQSNRMKPEFYFFGLFGLMSGLSHHALVKTYMLKGRTRVSGTVFRRTTASKERLRKLELLPKEETTPWSKILDEAMLKLVPQFRFDHIQPDKKDWCLTRVNRVQASIIRKEQGPKPLRRLRHLFRPRRAKTPRPK